ncbi:MAG: HU family DNA-binding protein [Myxococcales bacterium]|nr:HU family DNA-binding protein [Myxococcales bacterium]MCB9669629.1 HU family DNA-binding protein [Alphaproteobacteria bacterium]
MTWTDLVDAVATRTGIPRSQVKAVLKGLAEEVRDALLRGETVSVRGLGSWSRAWRQGRVVRSVTNRRKMWIGGRHRVRFRPTRSLQETIDQADGGWRSEEHQKAWRLAETLLDDLQLYHSALVPKDLDPEQTPEEVEERCRKAFGAHWEQVEHTWSMKVDGEVDTRFLGVVARRRWA